VTDTPNPPDSQNEKPPKRNWEAAAKPHWIEIVLGIFLAVIGVFQVCIYMRQASIMDRQATISSEQNAITVTTQRAFVSVNDIEIISHKDADGKVSSWEFNVIVENTGSTPTVESNYLPSGGQGGNRARDLNASFYPENMEPSVMDPAQHYYAVMHAFKTRRRLPLGPRAKRKLLGAVIEASHFKELYDGKFGAYFAGAIHYKDGFPNSVEHVTEFCFSARALEGDDGGYAPSHDVCPYWNCVDSECDADHRDYRADVEKAFNSAGKKNPPDLYESPTQPKSEPAKTIK
jgi:hypothetical protein